MKYNLSEITAVIKDRRTVFPENFSDRKVHEEIIKDILVNASWAPNHGMTQPWRFKVYTENGLTLLSDEISSLYKKLTPEENFKEVKFNKLKKRPLLTSAVVVVSMKRDPRRKIREIEEIEAVACAIQNMYLTATAYGIGTFWSSPAFIYTQEFNEFLNLEEEDRCLGLIYLGYPKDEWPKSYRKPLEHITEWIK
ncbi:MAG: nitroreductase [Saprospiraceae bacterium]